jgi:hypothetical protein
MLVAAALMATGAVVNGIGLRPGAPGSAEGEAPQVPVVASPPPSA